LRGNEAGPSRPQRYAHDGHDDHGRADATRSKLGNERCPDRQHAADADAGGSKNDPKPGKNGNKDAPVSKESSPCFLSVICFWRNDLSPQSLSVIARSCSIASLFFLENLPVSGKKQGGP
jgi:hypothetical protein